MKGIEIARLCNVSTSTLKHYEEWGLVPEIPRSENGYRNYSPVHLAYFQCIISLNIGYGMAFVKELMPLIHKGETMTVLWSVNQAQSVLQEERRQAEQILKLLEEEDVDWFDSIRRKKSHYTIGEAAEIAGVATSAIRHWELEQLINPARHAESGYRLFSSEDIRRILIIRTVSKAAWSLDIVREVLEEADRHDLTRTKEMAARSLEYIDVTLIARIKAMASLTALLDLICTESDIWAAENLGHYAYYQK